jgi:DNA (cytosine-5)-methyltransferase 1
MTISVVELFAGVGGFRIGLEGAPGCNLESEYKVIWANQWEPSTKKQHAAEVYTEKWNLKEIQDRPNWYSNGQDDIFVNEDINSIPVQEIPPHDLLVGGFPCQDYSVAKTLDKAKGLRGKKGVLWWNIEAILREHKPKMVLLENVDRLIKSPVKQRGRDFAIMLSCLDSLNYVVEWRVVNAADYGMPQRRRRVFICAYGPGTRTHSALKNGHDPVDWLLKDGNAAKAFPVTEIKQKRIDLKIKTKKNSTLADLTDNFNREGLPGNKSPFLRSGIMLNNTYHTAEMVSKVPSDSLNLASVLLPSKQIPDEFFLTPDSLEATKGWIYLKGSKKEKRKGTDGFEYNYNEGPVTFPDSVNKPSRTIITGEGGSGASRFKHVVKVRLGKNRIQNLGLDSASANRIREKLSLTKTQWLRRLVPEELELLNMFPAGHSEGQPDGRRAFFMGNALVIGIIERFAKEMCKD